MPGMFVHAQQTRRPEKEEKEIHQFGGKRVKRCSTGRCPGIDINAISSGLSGMYAMVMMMMMPFASSPADCDLASSAIFGQIDGLSMPGAGLRNLDFSSEVPSMFADFLVSNPGPSSTVQMPSARASSMSMQTLVRAYGSEHELSVYIPSDESQSL